MALLSSFLAYTLNGERVSDSNSHTYPTMTIYQDWNSKLVIPSCNRSLRPTSRSRKIGSQKTLTWFFSGGVQVRTLAGAEAGAYEYLYLVCRL